MINSIDISGGILILLLVFLGLRRGFLSTLLGLIMVYVSAYFASGFASGSARNFQPMGIDSQLAYTVLFLFIFSAVYLIGEVLIWIFKKIISIQLFGFLDSLMAALLGGFKGLIILGLIFNLITAFSLSPQFQESLEKSYIKKYSQEIYRKTYPVVRAAIPKIEKAVNENLSSAATPEAVIKTVNTVTSEVVKIIKQITP